MTTATPSTWRGPHALSTGLPPSATEPRTTVPNRAVATTAHTGRPDAVILETVPIAWMDGHAERFALTKFCAGQRPAYR